MCGIVVSVLGMYTYRTTDGHKKRTPVLGCWGQFPFRTDQRSNELKWTLCHIYRAAKEAGLVKDNVGNFAMCVLMFAREGGAIKVDPIMCHDSNGAKRWNRVRTPDLADTVLGLLALKQMTLTYTSSPEYGTVFRIGQAPYPLFKFVHRHVTAGELAALSRMWSGLSRRTFRKVMTMRVY